MIDKRVQYSVTNQESATGVIVDVITMKNDIKDNFTVTGYLICNDDTLELKAVQYWRLQKVMNSKGYNRGKNIA